MRLVAGLLLAALATPLHAGQFGVRAGTDLGGRTQYDSLEAFWRADVFGWRNGPPGWTATPQLELHGGRVESSRGDAMTIAGIGLHLVLEPPAAPLALRLGTGPTYVSRERLGARDLGGRFQFTSHIGLYLKLGQRIGLGYRIQHTSNASLYSDNEGLDLQAVEVRLSF